MKLATKLPLIVIPLISAPVLISGLLAFLYLKDVAIDEGESQVQAMTDQLNSRLERSIVLATANTQLFSQDPLMRDYLLAADEEERYGLIQRPLLAKFGSLQRAFPEYYEIRVLLPDGFEDLRLINNQSLEDSFDDSIPTGFNQIQAATDDVNIRIGLNPANDKLALFVSRRVNLANPAVDRYGSTPSTRGYLCLTVSLDDLSEDLRVVNWSQGGGVLTDQQGRIFAASPGLADTSILEDYELSSHIPADTQNTSGSMIINGKVFYFDVRQLYPGLWVHVLVSEAELFKDSHLVGKLVLGVSLIGLILIIPLLVLLQRQVLKPLRQLTSVLADYSVKNEPVLLKFRRKDEIAELGWAFNQMSHALYRSNSKIRKLAFHDSLTGLPNRTMFTKTLKRNIEAAQADGSHLALLFFDLDNFKVVNDTLGHPIGDKLLIRVAEIIQSRLRGFDTLYRGADCSEFSSEVARLGGDEFTLMLKHKEAEMVAAKVAERIIDALSHPIDISGNACYVGCSIGIAVYPFDGANGDELVKHADLAMYHAKKRGKGNFQYFSSDIARSSQERALLEQRLHRAVEQHQFRLYYQPVVESHTQSVVALEALIRWHDQTLGTVSPEHFIPVAEENGLIFPIGCWVLEEGLRQLSEWKKAGLDHIRLSINVSSVQLSLPGVAAQIELLLQQYQLRAKDICVELTETALLKGKEQAIENLSELRQLGILVALDDFGTGYSSLSYLKDLPIDIVKIDRSFINNLDDKGNRAILVAIINLAHSLGMRVVAEGIEDDAHIKFLSRHGCDWLQGYLFSRPLPAVEVFERVQQSADIAADETAI